MGFNSSHQHHDDEAMEIAEHHANGIIHHHDEDSKHHEEAEIEHHSTNDEKDNCCNHKVIQFNEVDKSANHSLTTVINSLYVSVFLALKHQNHLFYTSNITSTRHFVRSYHPPIPDIRIQIQSFQI